VQRPKFAPNITKENGALGGLLFLELEAGNIYLKIGELAIFFG